MVVCTLKAILTRRGVSQRELARRCGLHRRTIAKLYRDDWTLLTRPTLEKLCAGLRITPQQLLTWQDENN